MSSGLNYTNVRNVKSSYEYKDYQPMIYGILVCVYDKIKDEDLKRTLAKLSVDNYNGNMEQAYDKLENAAEKIKKLYAKFYKNKNRLDDIIELIHVSYKSKDLLYEKLFIILSLLINHIYELSTDPHYSEFFIRPDTIYLSKNSFYEDKSFDETVRYSLEFIKWASHRSTPQVYEMEYEALLEYYMNSTQQMMKKLGVIHTNQFITPTKTKMNGIKSLFGLSSRHEIPVHGGRRTRKQKKRRTHCQRSSSGWSKLQ